MRGLSTKKCRYWAVWMILETRLDPQSNLASLLKAGHHSARNQGNSI